MMPTRCPRIEQAFEYGGRCQASGRLDHHFHALGKKAHRQNELPIGHRQYVVDQRANDRKGEAPGRLRLRAVGNRLRHVDMDDFAAA